MNNVGNNIIEAYSNGDTAAYTITGLTTPQVTISPPSGTICEGQTITIGTTASGNSPIYSWNTGANSSNISTSLTPGNHFYAVTLTNGSNGCFDADTATLTVYANPIVMISVTDTTICQGSGTVTVTPTISGGSGSYNYDWTLVGGGGPVLQPNTPLNVSPSVSSSYDLSVMDLNTGCATSLTPATTINVSNCAGGIDIVSTGGNGYYCANTAITMGISSAISGSTFAWSNGGNTQYITETPPVSGNITYSVTITDPSGSTSILDTTLLIVNPNIQLTTSQNSVCSGGTPVSIDISDIGGSCASCDVLLGDSMSGGIHVYNGVPGSFTTNTPSVYYAQVVGCPQINIPTVVVNDGNFNFTINATSTNLCDGDSSILSVVGAPNGATYSWSTGETTPMITVFGGGTYDVTVTDPNSSCFSVANIVISATTNKIVSFNIPSPMQTTDPVFDLSTVLLDSGPGALMGTGTYSGSGVTGTNFDPNVAGIGTHLITYSYTDNGCTYSITSSVVVGSNTLSASFTNLNPDAGSFATSEACVNDVLEYNLSNFPFVPTEVEFSDGQGGFTPPQPVNIINVTPIGLGFDVTFEVNVPIDARTGTVRLIDNTGSSPQQQDIGALIVNYPDVSLIGVPTDICSDGTYTLTGVPAGGSLSAVYPSNATPATIFNGLDLDASQITGYKCSKW